MMFWTKPRVLRKVIVRKRINSEESSRVSYLATLEEKYVDPKNVNRVLSIRTDKHVEATDIEELGEETAFRGIHIPEWMEITTELPSIDRASYHSSFDSVTLEDLIKFRKGYMTILNSDHFGDTKR